MILEHIKSGVKFEYLCESKPKFTETVFVRLLNLKTNMTELFEKEGYLKHFKEV